MHLLAHGKALGLMRVFGLLVAGMFLLLSAFGLARAETVPLSLPSSVGGLPVPLSLEAGGSRMGACGRGCDIPLSYIRKDSSFAHRVPESSPGGAPTASERVYLTLLGDTSELVPLEGALGTWVPKVGTARLKAVESGDGWKVYDGDGRTYVFGGFRPDFWILDVIEGVGGSRVELTHERGTVTVGRPAPNSPFNVQQIALKSIRYNFSASGSPKNEILLHYGEVSAPTSITFVPGSNNGGFALSQFSTVERIEVKSRAVVGGPLRTLSTYELAYQADPDTGLRQLVDVKMSGQEGMAEAAQKLPLVRYEYGTATTPTSVGRELKYEAAGTIAIPNSADSVRLNVNKYFPQGEGATEDYTHSTQLIEDATGDGRADLIFRTVVAIDQYTLNIARNLPDANGKPSLTNPAMVGTFNGGQMQKKSFNKQTSYYVSSATRPNAEDVTELWDQFIDLNDDGRPDIIDAKEVKNSWVIYLNKPAEDYPHNTEWVRSVHHVGYLRDLLRSRGARIQGDYLPVKQVISVGLLETGQPISSPVTIPAVAWQLQDFNNDGKVDLLLEDSAPTTATDGVAFYLPRGRLRVVYGANDLASLLPKSEAVDVGGCGVNRTLEFGKIYEDKNSFALCELMDVNGDGLLDLIDYADASSDLRTKLYDLHKFPDLDSAQNQLRLAYLGTGRGFLAANIVMPGPARGTSLGCATGPYPRFARSEANHVYMDVTGDGLVDYLSPLGGDTVVHIGSGYGFAPPIKGPSQPQVGETYCGSSSRRPIIAGTDGFPTHYEGHQEINTALIDIDGDGRRDLVKGATFGSNVYTYSQLVGSVGGQQDPGALAAGRITAVENGHGGRTEYAYGNLKQQPNVLRQVPSPEIAVTRKRTLQGNDVISETTYAYGSPMFGYDPLAQRFRFFGYGRTVAVTATDSDARLPGIGKAIAQITDHYPLDSTFVDDKARFLRILKAGAVKETAVLAGEMGEASAMLATNIATDPRRIAGETFSHDARFFHGGLTPTPACSYFDKPYVATFNEGVFSTINTCLSRSFAFTSETAAWRGDAAPPSDKNVTTTMEVVDIDDFGRVTERYLGNDSRRDDDLCVKLEFATPTGTGSPVLSAVATETISTGDASSRCVESSVRSVDRFEYDGLPVGQVAKGLLTSQTAERRQVSDGSLLDTVRLFRATYDAQGNVKTIRRETGDGRFNEAAFEYYDAFGLAPLTYRVDATGAVPISWTMVYDNQTMLPIRVTDPNSTSYGTSYDGFGRPVLETVAPLGETARAASTTRYFGFDGSEARRIETKTFDEAVPVGMAGSAAGHVTTTSFDAFGRVSTQVADLGTDYADDLVTQSLIYDELGRIAFAADPFPKSQNAATAYGTTYFYNTDGTPKCSVRGHGPQSYSNVPDAAAERFPTCYRRWFEAGEEYVGVQDAQALDPASPNAGVEHRAAASAIGQVRRRETWKGTALLEQSAFTYDIFGNLRTHSRVNVAASPATQVTTSYAYDTFGQLLQFSEPATLPRNFTYSAFGELIEASTPASTTPPLASAWKQIMRYDGLGRLTHSEERVNDVVDPAMVFDYVYDQGVSLHAAQPATNVRGQLARAVSPTSQTAFGYDPYGNIAAQATKDMSGAVYIQTATHNTSGQLTALGFRLPDTDHALESMGYAYDSAGRLRRATFNHEEGGAGTLVLNTETYDVLGRLRSADFGLLDDERARLSADYAETGRRLLSRFTLTASDGNGHVFEFPTYDALGREVERRERKAAGAAITTLQHYDALGRLAKTTTAGLTESFTYDPLGNITAQDQQTANSADVFMTYRPDNLDRLCRITYGAPPTPGCNVTHDVHGNIIYYPTASGGRSLSYFGSGPVKSLTQNDTGALATFRYGAFGDVEELDVTGQTNDKRRDRRYGLIEKQDVITGGTTSSIAVRNYPLGPIQASRRGNGSDWIFAISEDRGNRVFVNNNGRIVQDVHYDPFGHPTNSGAQPGSNLYSHNQWNQGDSLTAFGLSHLGARLYDPTLGRFLSRDPKTLTRTSNTSNPYAFASNDPINRTDPTGMDDEEKPCEGCNGRREIIEVSGTAPPPPVPLYDTAFAFLVDGLSIDPLQAANIVIGASRGGPAVDTTKGDAKWLAENCSGILGDFSCAQHDIRKLYGEHRFAPRTTKQNIYFGLGQVLKGWHEKSQSGLPGFRGRGGYGINSGGGGGGGGGPGWWGVFWRGLNHARLRHMPSSIVTKNLDKVKRQYPAISSQESIFIGNDGSYSFTVHGIANTKTGEITTLFSGRLSELPKSMRPSPTNNLGVFAIQATRNPTIRPDGSQRYGPSTYSLITGHNASDDIHGYGSFSPAAQTVLEKVIGHLGDILGPL